MYKIRNNSVCHFRVSNLVYIIVIWDSFCGFIKTDGRQTEIFDKVLKAGRDLLTVLVEQRTRGETQTTTVINPPPNLDRI